MTATGARRPKPLKTASAAQSDGRCASEDAEARHPRSDAVSCFQSVTLNGTVAAAPPRLVLTLVAVCRFRPAQDINALVLLPPLALLGARGVAQLRRGAAAALDWFGIMTFSFVPGPDLPWLWFREWISASAAANNFVKNATGSSCAFRSDTLLQAPPAFTLGWIYLLARTPRGATRGVLRCAAGVALVWGLFATLIMPWADYQKSYRNVALQLKSKLPGNAGCVAGRGFGAPQLAAFSYHAGLPTSRATTGAAVECRFLLVQA